jgi:hypothetical protein
MHLRHRLTRRVVIGHGLEQRAPELAHRLLRHLRQFLSIAQHDETTDATLEICLGTPGDFSSLLALG